MRRDIREPRYTHCIREGCGKLRRGPKGKWCLDAWLIDGFCSTECAKAHYSVNVRPSADLVLEQRDFDRAFEENAA